VAVTTGILGSGSAIGIGGEITTDVMGQLPLVLIPCYFVPIFIMLHLTALFMARGARVQTGFAVFSEPRKNKKIG
jgi:hypothetical protein